MQNNKIDKIINGIGGTMMTFLMLCTSYNVICFWITGNREGAVDDLIMSIFVWVVYIGVGSLYANGEQISVSFIVNLLPPTVQKAISVFDDIVMLVVSTFIAYYAIKLSIRGLNLLTPVLKLPFFFIDISLVLGFSYVILDIGRKIVIITKKVSNAKKEGE